MMNQQGALGRPPMLRGALTPPVRYADGGAVEIPPELAAMSYEQILALLQAQQGALGFADGGDAGDGEGDGGEGEGEGEGGGGEAAGGGAGGGGMGGGYGDDGTGSSAGPSGGSAGPSGTGSAEGSQAGGGFGNDGVSSNSSVPGEQDIADFNAAQAVAGLNADLTAPTFDDITAPVTSTVPALSIAEKEPNFVDRTLADLKNNLSNRADILGGIISDIAKGNLSGLAAKADRAMQDKQAEPAMMGFMSLTPLGSLPAALNAISGPISKGLDAVFGGVAKGLGVDFAHGPISMNDMGDGREPVAAVTDTAPVTVDAGPAAGPAPGQTWLDRWMGPQQAANGGALGYANGGKVPAGAHVIPADVVAAKGNGSSRAGALAYKPLGGKLVNGSGDGRSDSVPAQGPRGALRLSRDEVVIPPQGVKKAGGHGALARDAMQTRQQFRQHLGALPPPRGSREHGKRNGGAFADGGEVEPRRGTPGQMRALYADPTREAGAYEPQGPTWGDLRDMWLASQAEDAEAERVADEAFRAKRLEAGDWSYAPETMGPFGQKVVEGLGMNALTIGKLANAAKALPMDEASRMARADQSFPLEVYHSTRATEPFDSFRVKGGPQRHDLHGVHVGTLEAADQRAQKYFGKDYGLKSGVANESQAASIMPLRARVEQPYVKRDGSPYSEAEIRRQVTQFAEKNKLRPDSIEAKVQFRKKLLAGGYDAIPYVNTVEDKGSISYLMLKPENLRSRFATFDPSKLDSSDLLAGLIPALAAGGLGLQMMTPEEQAGALPPPRR